MASQPRTSDQPSCPGNKTIIPTYVVSNTDPITHLSVYDAKVVAGSQVVPTF